MPARREVIYPIFLKVMNQTDDIFWKEIMEDLAYGIAPVGTYISKGVLCCKQSSREFVYRFLDKDPSKIGKDIIKLLQQNNFMSKNDRKIMLTEFTESEKKIHDMRSTEWVNIKKKSLKDTLFQNYLIDIKKKFSLRDSQVKKVYNFINLGLLLKTIKPCDITYYNGDIVSIKGVTFSQGSCSLDFDIYEGFNTEVLPDDEIYKPCKKYLKDL